MARTLAVLLLGWLSCTAWAAKKLTVDQFEQLLPGLEGKPDLLISQRITDLELTERLSPERAAKWRAALSGELTQQALTALADRAAFLDPPANEIPQKAAPDIAEQRRMMGLVVAYVSKTIPQLPNFIATRETVRYEDTPQLETVQGLIPFQPLHRIDRASATVVYRDGREEVDAGPSKKAPAQHGLSTWGVFGPILSTVILDASKSKLEWSHWEQTASGPAGVFRYAVPKEKSHYEVNYCCVLLMDSTTSDLKVFRRLAGYNGTLSVDPATGAIVRLTLDAEMGSTDPITRASVLVEYGPVEIGSRTYICPRRSVSISLAQEMRVSPAYHRPDAYGLQPLQTALNDVAFGQYHLFRAEAKVLTDDAVTRK